MATRILCIDDDSNICDLLCMYLQKEGYEVRTAQDGQEGVSLFRAYEPDLVLLDIMMPRMDGWQVCQEIRKQSSKPIIMVTAKGETIDKVLGLELGADDYITKPFSMRELLARIKANIRRTDMNGTVAPVQNVGVERISVDVQAMMVYKDGKPLELTQREYELVRVLTAQKGQVFSRETLMEQVWNYGGYGDVRAVDVAVRRLREKIEDDPAEPQFILTRRGAGYVFGG